MKSMFRLATAIALASSCSTLALAEGKENSITTSAASKALLAGCPGDDIMAYVKLGLTEGRENKARSMANCPAYTMGFDEGKLHFNIREANANKDEAVKAKLLENKPLLAKVDALKTSPRRDPIKDCIPQPKPSTVSTGEGITFGLRSSPRRDDTGKVIEPALPYCPPEKVTLPEKCPTHVKSYLNGGADVLKTSPRRDEHGNVITTKCTPVKKTGDSWADRQAEKANAERAMSKAKDSAADKTKGGIEAAKGISKGSSTGSKGSDVSSKSSSVTTTKDRPGGMSGGEAGKSSSSTTKDRPGGMSGGEAGKSSSSSKGESGRKR